MVSRIRYTDVTEIYHCSLVLCSTGIMLSSQCHVWRNIGVRVWYVRLISSAIPMTNMSMVFVVFFKRSRRVQYVKLIREEKWTHEKNNKSSNNSKDLVCVLPCLFISVCSMLNHLYYLLILFSCDSMSHKRKHIWCLMQRILFTWVLLQRLNVK